MNEKLGYAVQQTTRGNVEAAASEDFDEESLYLDCSRCSRVDCRPNLCAKSIGKCMRLDCESMQQYCDESRSAELSLNFGDGLAGQAAAVLG